MAINSLSGTAKKETKQRAAQVHPGYSIMIETAVKTLKDRTGSSRQAILKYIMGNYKVRGNRIIFLGVFICQYLRSLGKIVKIYYFCLLYTSDAAD